MSILLSKVQMEEWLSVHIVYVNRKISVISTVYIPRDEAYTNDDILPIQEVLPPAWSLRDIFCPLLKMCTSHCSRCNPVLQEQLCPLTNKVIYD